jgi:hypothetical protein
MVLERRENEHIRTENEKYRVGAVHTAEATELLRFASAKHQ